jgi:hypothetical protein
VEDDKSIFIINIYNPYDKDNLIEVLYEYLQINLYTEDYNIIIILRDFNLYHDLWNPKIYKTEIPKVDELIGMIIEFGLELLLSSRMIIYPNSEIVIDLIWGNERVK